MMVTTNATSAASTASLGLHSRVQGVAKHLSLLLFYHLLVLTAV
jgi:hypothetical protein